MSKLGPPPTSIVKKQQKFNVQKRLSYKHKKLIFKTPKHNNWLGQALVITHLSLVFLAPCFSRYRI